MQYKAVIFDLDGTLIDTIDDLADSMNNVLRKAGFPTHDKEKYKYFVGDGMKNLVKRALPEGNYDDSVIEDYLSQIKQEYSKNWKAKSRPYPGIPELLDSLEGINIPKAVLSNKPHEFTVQVIRELLPKWHFDYVYGERQGITRKPDPSGALEIARNLGVEPCDILYLGDTSTDMKTARNARMYAVGVLWGFREEPELLEYGAHTVISEPMELMELLK